MMSYTKKYGFTLAELLIALAILGVIATFTIPKILVIQQEQAWNAEAKEVFAAVSEAFQLYKASNPVRVGTKLGGTTQYINYVTIRTTGLVDGHNFTGSNDCSNVNYTCLVFHNGGILVIENAYSFTGTTANHGVWFYFDPDGQYIGDGLNVKGKAVSGVVYANGAVLDGPNLKNPTIDTAGSWGPHAGPLWWKGW